MIPDMITANFVARQKEMETDRQQYEDLMQDASDWVNPRRQDWTGASRGQYRQSKMYSAVAQDAMLTWVDGVLGWGISEAMPWFETRLNVRKARESPALRRYCQEYNEQMMFEFGESNFYEVFPEGLRDGASVGNATMVTLDDDGTAMDLVCHPRQIWILLDFWGRVIAVHRKFTMTAGQARIFFKGQDDRLSKNLIKDAQDPAQDHNEYEFLHCVCKNDDEAIFEAKQTFKPWASVYIECGPILPGSTPQRGNAAQMVRLKGFDFNPYTVWLFRRNSDEANGYSPAMDVMVEIYKSQQFGKDLLLASHLSVDPAFMIPEDLRNEYSLLPHGRNFYRDPKKVISPIFQGLNFPIGLDRENACNELIRGRYGYTFWKGLNMMASQKGKERVTATQIMEWQSETAVLLVSQVGNLYRDFVTPIWDKKAAIAQRAGRLPDPPGQLDEYQGKNVIKPRFIGPLAQAQEQLFRMRGIKTGLNMILPLEQTHPEMGDRVNWSETGEDILVSSGFPQRLMFDDDEVQQIQQSRQQAIERKEQMEQAAAAAQAVPKLSKPIEKGSPMEAMASMAG